MQLNTLIVDDEPLARNVIQQYAKKVPGLNIVCSCEDGVDALEIIKDTNIDLIFLDINMPLLSGISMLKTLENPPMVIFTTAYTEFALEGYELNAVDYLKKPFSFERFLKAVNKAAGLAQLKAAGKTSIEPAQEDYIFIKANKKTVRINFSQIICVEGLGDYIKINLPAQNYVTNMTMKKIQEVLPSSQFYRVHKSFIIALDKIESIEGNVVQVQKMKIPIGNNYRQEFFDLINQRFPE